MDCSDGQGRCAAEFHVGPATGAMRCELQDGHQGQWHRSEDAGWEWVTGQLWPLLPRSAA